MTTTQTAEPIARRPLRLWPGVVLATLLGLLWYVMPAVFPDAGMYGVMAGMLCAVLIPVWWLFFSRAPWSERLGAIALMVVTMYATFRVVHVSIAKGAMGYLFPVLATPALLIAFVAWAAATRRLTDGLRRTTMVATILLACAAWTLVRTGGFSGGFDHDFAWRWSETPEERLLAQADEVPASLPSAPVAVASPETPASLPAAAPSVPAAPSAPAATAAPGGGGAAPITPPASAATAAPAAPAAIPAEWPGFRGPGRDGAVRGVRIATDWSAAPPVELWRRPIGPGWSSFAVQGDVFYTQEQRGDDEVVASYQVTTGQPIWRHRDPARFWESNAGAGPRATPTLSNGRLYTFGATGIVNALDARSGAVVWSRNAASDTGAKTPTWGFAGSPLVIDEVVVVAASGALAAYDASTGERRWVTPVAGASYSSPHRATIDGITQVLLLSGDGVRSFSPADGALLWEHRWEGYPIVQPALTAEGDVLISANQDSGTRRIALARGPGGWSATERWTSSGLKPYFNDFVVHEGHAFGFDGRILACIDLADGQRKWKGGRYGSGQLVLLPDQDLLLVLSEDGDLALVGAAPDQYKEFARVPGIEGKTWNHPVLAGDTLLVRNAQEMAAFRLAPASR